jgi:phosphatidylethanolamine/phosphatidyl-N-methylethanolamine N-methyltransferase
MRELPHRQNPLLRMSYSFIAPIYDFLVAAPMRAARKQSLAALPDNSKKHVLISGVGTGLDLPLLPKIHRYTALDFTPAMLSRAKPRAIGLEIDFTLGDSMALPFKVESFDHVVLHLIVAVVPESNRCLAEAARVLKPGGTILLFDKFLKPGQRAPLRRLVSPLLGRFATRTNVVLEELLPATPSLEVVSDVPMLGGNWFRAIVLRKSA